MTHWNSAGLWKLASLVDSAIRLVAIRESGSIRFAVAWMPCYHVTVIQSFRDKGVADVFDGKNSRAARKSCPRSLWPVATRKLDMLDSAETLDDLRVPPGNRLEALSGDQLGQHGIRINDRHRITFFWSDLGPEEVEIVDYH